MRLRREKGPGDYPPDHPLSHPWHHDRCACGHKRVDHYDEYLFCTVCRDGCGRFKEEGAE